MSVSVNSSSEFLLLERGSAHLQSPGRDQAPLQHLSAQLLSIHAGCSADRRSISIKTKTRLKSGTGDQSRPSVPSSDGSLSSAEGNR